jgi:quercetin 2,3-dioxygenase
MDTIRPIKKVITGREAVDGAGVKLVRVFGYNEIYDFDPFLMLDAFDSVNPEDYIKGFPWHPHRGIETITYLIEGEIDHGDSLGNKGSILSGCCQWMTAGAGIIHQEMPIPSKRLLGIQLWLNLPAKDKMTKPKYNDIKATDIPIINEDGSNIHIICGKYKEVTGALIANHVKALYLDVELKDSYEWSLETISENNLFIYIIKGSAYFGDKQIAKKHAVLFDNGNEFRVRAGKDGVRFLLMSGKPLKETIAWSGPIVMNTEEELNQAYKDLDDGTFTA